MLWMIKDRCCASIHQLDGGDVVHFIGSTGAGAPGVSVAEATHLLRLEPVLRFDDIARVRVTSGKKPYPVGFGKRRMTARGVNACRDLVARTQ
jgi:hypothetical protein